MSCWMVKTERIAQLADYISALANMGFNYFGYSIPEKLNRELKDCYTRGYMDEKKVFSCLFDLNQRSVCGRYKEEPQETPDFPNIRSLYHPRERARIEDVGRWVEDIKPWHFELLKLLKCFIYQCDEDATYQDPVKLGLEDLDRTISNHIIYNMPEMQRATWG